MCSWKPLLALGEGHLITLNIIIKVWCVDNVLVINLLEIKTLQCNSLLILVYVLGIRTSREHFDGLVQNYSTSIANELDLQ